MNDQPPRFHKGKESPTIADLQSMRELKYFSIFCRPILSKPWSWNSIHYRSAGDQGPFSFSIENLEFK